MKTEIVIYLLIVALAIAYRHVLSGRKNGCFYHKNDKPLPPMLARAIKNIHFIETTAWYALSAVAFFSFFAVERALHYTTHFWGIVWQIFLALMFMAGTYEAPSYHFQRGITAGLKDDDHLDARNDSEVAIVIFGKKIQFWKGRLFSNRKRKWAQWIGLGLMILSVILF